MLGQDIHIVFSQVRKKRPVVEIEKVLSDFIQSSTASGLHEVTMNGRALVGKRISHRFEVEASQQMWYNGTIMKYDSESRTFEIKYDEEEECYSFDLTEDAAMAGADLGGVCGVATPQNILNQKIIFNF